MKRIIHKEVEQGTPEWFALRCGNVTSSKFKDVMSSGRGTAPSQTRLTYMMELAAQRCAGKVFEGGYSNEWMERGTMLEAQARAMIEFERSVEVEQVGYISLGDEIGSSTDGLIGEDTVLEIKCPKHTTHYSYLLNPELLYKAYKHQTQGELWVSGRDKLILCSFHPEFNNGDDLITLEVDRDVEFIAEMEEAVDLFVKELNELEPREVSK